MEIWNEGEILRKRIIPKSFEIRQLKPKTRNHIALPPGVIQMSFRACTKDY